METTAGTRDETPGGHAELDRVRSELAALRKRFRSIIQRNADGIVVVDEEGGIRFANEAAERLFGHSAEALTGRPFGHALVTGETTEIDILRRSGPVTAELRVMDTEWEGQAARLVSLRDVTDRKKAEERSRRLLREQVARAEAEEAAWRAEMLSEAGRRLSSSLDLETTLDSTVALVVEQLADYCVLDLVDNGRVRRFTAAREDDARRALLREAEDFPFDLDGATPQAEAYRTREARLVAPVTKEWLRSAAVNDAHYDILRSLAPHSVLVAPLFTGQECLGVLTAGCLRPGTTFDDSHVHLTEELGQRVALAVENARLYRDAQAANRAKTNFLSVMSHELRTPLSAIIGYADLIDRGIAGETTSKQKHFLSRIRTSSNHLLQIIEEILAFAGTEAGEEQVTPEATTLGALVEAVSAVSEPLADDTALEFTLTVDDPDAVLHTDSRKVRQILLNLISNALKFTNEGWVRLEARMEGDGAAFVVRDTGVGIPRDRLDQIFEQFWQVEDPMTRQAGGTGLGLTIARRFAELLGGTIEVESEEGEGSTFTLRIPRDAAA